LQICNGEWKRAFNAPFSVIFYFD